MIDAAIVEKTNQWRYAQRICFKPKTQAQKDFIDALPKLKRSAKLNQVLTFFLSTDAYKKVVPLYYRENAASFDSVTFQPSIQNARLLQPCRATRGKVSAIMQKALDLVISRNETQTKK
jgi:hypothetical protein